ncbi:MAG: hypothetical protein WD696_16390 [Bryobacteraceae bacterium]
MSNTINPAFDEIDQEIERLRALKELASDPRMFALMQKVVASARTTPQEPAAVIPGPALARWLAPFAAHSGDQATIEEGVTEAVASKVSGYAPGVKFTHNEIHDALVEAGYKFSSKQPRVAVSGALRRFSDYGRFNLRVVGKGRGGATVYERAPEADTAATSTEG